MGLGDVWAFLATNFIQGLSPLHIWFFLISFSRFQLVLWWWFSRTVVIFHITFFASYRSLVGDDSHPFLCLFLIPSAQCVFYYFVWRRSMATPWLNTVTYFFRVDKACLGITIDFHLFNRLWSRGLDICKCFVGSEEVYDGVLKQKSVIAERTHQLIRIYTIFLVDTSSEKEIEDSWKLGIYDVRGCSPSGMRFG